MKRRECQSVIGRSQRHISTAIAATVAVGMFGSAASAQNLWTGAGGDTRYLNPANWSFGEVPGVSDIAVLNNGGTVTIAEPGARAFQFRVGQAVEGSPNLGGTVNFEAGGEFITGLDNVAAGDVGVSPLEAGASAVWNHKGGTFQTRELFRLGVGAGSVGTLNMSGGQITGQPVTNATTGVTTTVLPRLFLIGDNGQGHLNMTGGTIDARTFAAGWLPPSGPGNTITVGGGTLNTTEELVLGRFGGVTVNMTGGTINSNFDIRLQQLETSTSTLTMSGGLMKSNFNFIQSGATFGEVGAKSTANLSGGTMNLNQLIVLSDSHYAESTFNHTGGTLTGREMLVGKWSDSQYNLSGDGVLDVASQLNIGTFQARERDGREPTDRRAANINFTQSGNGTLITGGLIVAEQSTANFFLNGGSVRVTGVARDHNGTASKFPGAAADLLFQRSFGNLVVGRDGATVIVSPTVTIDRAGKGRVVQTAGTMTVDTSVYLGDFDEGDGSYEISGGTLTVGRNFSVGGALASNAADDGDRLDTQGQVLKGATGRLTVRGSAASISIAGDFLANPADRDLSRAGSAPGQSMLNFELDNGGITQILVGGQADLDGAVVDMGFVTGSTIVPAFNQAFDLITAQQFGATGTGTTQATGTGEGFTLAAADAADWLLRVVAGGNGEILQAVNRYLAGDTNADKIVNFTDLVKLAQNYNAPEGRTRETGDFNRDGATNFADLVALAQNYNRNESGAMQFPSGVSEQFRSDWALAQSMAVPEPTTLGLLSGASMLLMRRRRAK